MGSRGSERRMREATYNGIVRRMVNLPRSILGGFSRAVDQGIDLMRTGGRRTPSPFPSNYPPPYTQHNYLPNLNPSVQPEWEFLASYEQHYGTIHPFFYACRFVEALKMAQDEHKFVFLYLHSPDHPFTPSFCRDTLCSEVVEQFLDANFVSWGGIADRGEGLNMAATLRPSSFPFCAVVAPAAGESLAVLHQVEGPVSPAELLELLQRVMEEQGVAFGSRWAKEEEKRKADRRLREQQDAAYVAALTVDQGKEKIKSSTSHEIIQKPEDKINGILTKKFGKAKEAIARKILPKDSANGPAQAIQILIRFPNGERREKSFLSTDKVQSIYRYIDSLGLPGVGGNYKLITSFPRKEYGVDQIGLSLKDVGLHPRTSLFLEFL